MQDTLLGNVVRQKDFSFGFSKKACETCGGKCCVGESGYIFLSLIFILLARGFCQKISNQSWV